MMASWDSSRRSNWTGSGTASARRALATDLSAVTLPESKPPPGVGYISAAFFQCVAGSTLSHVGPAFEVGSALRVLYLVSDNGVGSESSESLNASRLPGIRIAGGT